MNKKKPSIFTNRRFKYGSAAVALTVVFIAAVIAFNAIFSALANRFTWYVDMTEEQVYGLSDAGRTLLQDLDNGKSYSVVFFCDPDELDANYTGRVLHTFMKNVAAEFDFLDIKYLDSLTSPQLADKYKTTANSNISTSSVIIESDTDFRVYAIDAFYHLAESDNSLFAFRGELQLLTALIQLGEESPIAYFTVGHGETTETSALYKLFSTAGYDVRTIDLSKEEPAENAQVLIINDPKYDFAGESKSGNEVNEIEKIDSFLDGFGHLMVFIDPSTQKLAELEDFLYEWGISFTDTVVKDYENSVSTDGYSLVAAYPSEGLGSTALDTIRNMENPPKTIVRYATPIDLWFEERGNRTASAILTSHSSARSYDVNTGAELDRGIYDLMVISAESEYIDNFRYSSYVIVAGTSLFADEAYLYNDTYGNGDILYTLMKSMGKKQVPIDIDFKVFEDNALDITTSQANGWTVFITVFAPAVVLIVGAVVFFRRRHL